jgi:hypothetical protein
MDTSFKRGRRSRRVPDHEEPLPNPACDQVYHRRRIISAASSFEPRSIAANRRPRSLTDFLITIKKHSQLLSTKTDFCSEMALVGMTEVQAECPPSCENCGRATIKVGKLSRLGSHPLINVYKCQPCRQIISITSALFISDLCIRPEDVRSRE